MTRPAMTFDADVLASQADRIVDGPIVVYWGQEREVFYRHGELDYGEPPRRRLLGRLLRHRRWKVTIRIAPPAGVPLKDFGQDIARILGIPYGGDPRDGDAAIWLPASVMTRTAGGALGAAGKVLARLGGLQASEIQARVEEWSR